MASPKRILADLKLFARGYTRTRIGLFFSLVFPIILILLFGAIFAGGNGGSVNVYVQNQDNGGMGGVGQQFVSALNSTGTIKPTLVDSSIDFKPYILAHSSSAGIQIPSNFTSAYTQKKQVSVTVYSNPADTTSGILLAVVAGVVNGFNLQAECPTAPATPCPPVIGLNKSSITSESAKYIDFLVPGLIGFSVLTSPMFSMVNISSDYKKSKFFKQLSLTPLTKTEWLTSKMLWYTFLSIVSFILMTTVGTYLFGANISVSILILPFLVLGPLLFVSLGMLVGTVSKSVESAAVVGNLITFPMMFLSGTFFPVSQMPAYLQNVAHVLPLFYVIDGLNQVMVYHNLGPMLTDVLVLLVASAIVFVLAVSLFKWRED